MDSECREVELKNESDSSGNDIGDHSAYGYKDKGYGCRVRVLLSIAGGVMVMYFVISRFRQLADYLDRLTSYVTVNITYIDVILKMIGLAYVCQFSSDICKDAGYNAIASQVEMAGKLSLILLSMPVLMSVIDLVVKIVEG